jgi:hypothetical protein
MKASMKKLQPNPKSAGDSTAWKAKTFSSTTIGGLKGMRNTLDKAKGTAPASIIKQKVGMLDREISRREASIKAKTTPKKMSNKSK